MYSDKHCRGKQNISRAGSPDGNGKPGQQPQWYQADPALGPVLPKTKFRFTDRVVGVS